MREAPALVQPAWSTSHETGARLPSGACSLEARTPIRQSRIGRWPKDIDLGGALHNRTPSAGGDYAPQSDTLESAGGLANRVSVVSKLPIVEGASPG
jgi:hypothetical protein